MHSRQSCSLRPTLVWRLPADLISRSPSRRPRGARRLSADAIPSDTRRPHDDGGWPPLHMLPILTSARPSIWLTGLSPHHDIGERHARSRSRAHARDHRSAWRRGRPPLRGQGHTARAGPDGGARRVHAASSTRPTGSSVRQAASASGANRRSSAMTLRDGRGGWARCLALLARRRGLRHAELPAPCGGVRGMRHRAGASVRSKAGVI